MPKSKRIVLHDEDKLRQVNPNTLSLLEKYKVDMMMRNLSQKTQQHYVWDLQQWFIYVFDHQNNKSVLDVTDDDLTEFLYYCKSYGNNSERIKLRIATISAFYKFMRKKHYIKDNPVEFIDRPKRGASIIPQTYLTPEQVAILREKLIAEKNIQLRLYAMLSLSTMARVSAIASIRWDQVDLKNKIIHNVLEKEAKIVDLYFSDEVRCLFQELLEERTDKNINDYGYVFYSRVKPNSHVATGTLGQWSKNIGKLIGVPSLHPHDFRHSGATLLKNAGMSLEDVSVLLSHESTDTTKKYYIKQDSARISSLKSLYNI